MTYDLMVFEKTKSPKTKLEFLKWYDMQTEWGEEHDYQTINLTSTALQNWFMEIIQTFPPMNDEFAPAPELFEENTDLEDYVADYSIGTAVIYVAFPWSHAEEAYLLSKELAKKHEVGFFDVSENDGDILFPDGTILS